jgi:predicted metal-dependent phosphoesterase TrpH
MIMQRADPSPSDGRESRADLHIHTMASDGTSSVAEILDAAGAAGLDIIAITDHERIDAASAARSMAIERADPFEVIVGEEVTTRGGHLLGLFLEARVPPLRSLGWTIAAIHDQGGLAIPAHPLVPFPLCAQGWVLRRLLASPDPRDRPDAIEAFNPTTLGRPWHSRVVAFAAVHGLPVVGNSDAHAADQVGRGWTSFPGRGATDLRTAIAAGETRQHGTFHGHGSMVTTFGRQLRKYQRDARAELHGRIRRDGTGRDLGYEPRAAEPERGTGR